MTSINLPNTIANGDVPDWDAVQAYFDAIVAAAETTGWDNSNIKAGAAIAYSKLNLTGSVTNADLAGSISATKLSRSTVHSDNSSSLTNLTPTAWTNTGTTFTASATGLHLISCSGQVTNNAASSGYVEHRSRLVVNLTVTGITLIDKRWMDTTSDLSVPFSHFLATPLASGDIVNHQVYSAAAGSDVATAGFNIHGFCVQA